MPLVIAGDSPGVPPSPTRIAQLVARLEPVRDWEVDEAGRNVQLTDRGIDRVQEELSCGELDATENYGLLIEVNQALHARALLRRDVDYTGTRASASTISSAAGPGGRVTPARASSSSRSRTT